MMDDPSLNADAHRHHAPHRRAGRRHRPEWPDARRLADGQSARGLLHRDWQKPPTLDHDRCRRRLLDWDAEPPGLLAQPADVEHCLQDAAD
jgi:hypothetical protein